MGRLSNLLNSTAQGGDAGPKPTSTPPLVHATPAQPDHFEHPDAAHQFAAYSSTSVRWTGSPFVQWEFL